MQSSDVNPTQSPASACSLILVTRLPPSWHNEGYRQWGFVPSFSEAAQSASPAEGSVEETRLGSRHSPQLRPSGDRGLVQCTASSPLPLPAGGFPGSQRCGCEWLPQRHLLGRGLGRQPSVSGHRTDQRYSNRPLERYQGWLHAGLQSGVGTPLEGHAMLGAQSRG